MKDGELYHVALISSKEEFPKKNSSKLEFSVAVCARV